MKKKYMVSYKCGHNCGNQTFDDINEAKEWRRVNMAIFSSSSLFFYWDEGQAINHTIEMPPELELIPLPLPYKINGLEKTQA